MDKSDEVQNVLNNPIGLTGETQKLRLNFDTYHIQHNFDRCDFFACRSVVYGQNEINVPLQGIGTLILLEILNPIYFFQVFSLIVWFCESYYYYTVAIIIMSFYGITSNVIQTHRVK
jgi:hypothetical protein